MRTPQIRVNFIRSMQMCRQRIVTTRTKKFGENFWWSMKRIGGMSTACNGEVFRRGLKRVGRMMMVVLIYPLHSQWSGKYFLTWMSKILAILNTKTVMGMIHMVTWGYLVNYYVTYDWFVDIWGFNKEEILSHYKVLEKIVWVWIDDKNHCPDRCGTDGRITT